MVRGGHQDAPWRSEGRFSSHVFWIASAKVSEVRRATHWRFGGCISPAIRGACFGLRQSMDTLGACLGPLLAIFIMFAFSDDIRQVLWFAVAPAFMAVFLILIGIEEPERASAQVAVFSLRFGCVRSSNSPATTGVWWPSARSSRSPDLARRFSCCAPSR